MEESEWGHASVDRPVPGDEIGPNGDNPGTALNSLGTVERKSWNSIKKGGDGTKEY